MLIQLTPEQISKYYNDIEAGIKVSVPPLAKSSPEVVTRVMERLIGGTMQAWMLVDWTGPEKAPTIYALAVTVLYPDIGSGYLNLLIYALYGYVLVPDALWREGLETLKKYAASVGAGNVVAFTRVPRIVQIVEALGGDTATRFISLEV